MKTFDQLFWPIRPKLYKYALKITGNPTDAEDIVMVAVAKAWRAFGTYDHENSFSGWIHTITRNAWRDELKARRSRVSTCSFETRPEGCTETYREILGGADPKLTEGEDIAAACDILRSMAKVERRVVLALKVDNWGNEDIAVALGKTPEMVRRILFSARRELLRRGV